MAFSGDGIFNCSRDTRIALGILMCSRDACTLLGGSFDDWHTARINWHTANTRGRMNAIRLDYTKSIWYTNYCTVRYWYTVVEQK